MTDPLRAEVKSIEEGKRAYRHGPRSFSVMCEHPEACGTSRHHLRVELVPSVDGGRQLVIRCDCPSGRIRGQSIDRSIVCYHGATVAHRLEREKLVVWSPAGNWYATGEGIAKLSTEPQTRIFNARGVCSTCRRFVNVKGSVEIPEPRPEMHDRVCHERYLDRKRAAEARPTIDLWQRDERNR